MVNLYKILLINSFLDFLSKYAKSFQNTFSKILKHDPVDEFDKKWARENIVRMSEIFLENNVLELNDFSEANLLHNMVLSIQSIQKQRSQGITRGKSKWGCCFSQ
ncbi:hypothetical protein BDF21DRAFT_449041 [Thamnidium elegans]|nr:hypothetical protein BDF21DRAFT_449041 [Thamnidium elegans]